MIKLVTQHDILYINPEHISAIVTQDRVNTVHMLNGGKFHIDDEAFEVFLTKLKEMGFILE